MGSQFVDLDADGHLDYLTATFDGSPHVSYGSTEGFGEPVRLLDSSGQRILISSIWDYEQEEHVDLAHALSGELGQGTRCISALAYDWDRDGDLDLLLGSYEEGRLFRQMNEGTPSEPSFTGENIPVLAGGEPFGFKGKLTTPRLVDWDGDGDLDLVLGTFQGADDGPASIYLSLDEGQPGKPAFSRPTVLVTGVPTTGSEPLGPSEGLYAEPVDMDGDGDLDLVVGGYSIWTPPGRELTVEEQARVDELRERIDAHWKAMETQDEDEAFATYLKASELQDELDELVPSQQRTGQLWLYERLDGAATETSDEQASLQPTPREPLVAALELESTPTGHEVLVRVAILEGWHAYGEREGSPYRALSPRLSVPDGVTPTGGWTRPRPSSLDRKSGAPRYEGELVFRHGISATDPSRLAELTCELDFQVCDEAVCHPPRTLELSLRGR